MEKSGKVSSKMVSRIMGMVFIIILMVKSMSVSGKMDYEMVRGHTPFLMVESMSVSGKMDY